MENCHRIDVHHHILPPNYVEIVGDDRIGPLILAGKTPEWTPQMSIEAMDRNGIQTALTSISAPGLWFGETQETIDLCRHCNEYAAEITRDHPTRFGVFASLPLPDRMRGRRLDETPVRVRSPERSRSPVGPSRRRARPRCRAPR